MSFTYDYNPANQRVRRREGDGRYWRYEYDVLGQVRSGRKYWAEGTPVAGQQFEYAFDDIGNRIWTGAGGNAGGTGLRSASYSANVLNQYSSRTVPGAVDVMGMALATNSVTVNGQSVYRKGEYFRKELSVNNASSPVWQQVDVAAPNETTVTRHEFIPKTPESFTHDADGNLTQDGRWHYTWDGENRLVRMSSANTNPAVGPQQWVEYEYDWQGRRISKKVGAAGSGVATNDLRCVYDGWNVAARLAADLSPLASFAWGLDVSGTMQGAGGVGGLLWMTVPSGANAGTYFCAYDGNGNVMTLVSAADGSVAAHYEYGPFGELIRATGPVAQVNPFRFSTKHQDDETGLVYYGYRYYDPGTGRWVSRDPIGERGGLNFYAACGNSHSCRIDKDGRMAVEGCPPKAKDLLKTAFSKACRRIRSTDFGCCMVGSALGRDYQSRLGYLCDRHFTVKCALEHTSPSGGVARALPNESTILIYNAFFSHDAAGWGSHACIMAHEMLHLVGPLHPQADRLFNRLHQCLGCPRYRDFSDWKG